MHTAINGHLVPGVGYCHLVGVTTYGSLLRLDYSEDTLPLSEMLGLYDNTQIRTWWRQCPPTELMDVLFRKDRHSESESGTPAPFTYAHGGRDNRDEPNTNTAASEEPEDHLESHSANDTSAGQPESSAIAAKRGAPPEAHTSRTLRTYSTAHTSHTAKASTSAPQRPRDSQPDSSATASKQWGRPGRPKLSVRSDPAVWPKLPVQRRLVLGPRDRREIEVG